MCFFTLTETLEQRLTTFQLSCCFFQKIKLNKNKAISENTESHNWVFTSIYSMTSFLKKSFLSERIDFKVLRLFLILSNSFLNVARYLIHWHRKKIMGYYFSFNKMWIKEVFQYLQSFIWIFDHAWLKPNLVLNLFSCGLQAFCWVTYITC